MGYKKGDGVRVRADAIGDFAPHKGRRGEVLVNGPQMGFSKGSLVMGFAGISERMILSYSVRLYADKSLPGTQDDMTIPAESLEVSN